MLSAYSGSHGPSTDFIVVNSYKHTDIDFLNNSPNLLDIVRQSCYISHKVLRELESYAHGWKRREEDFALF